MGLLLAVADRAGLSGGALYRHFPSKADLLVEVFRDTAKREMAAVDEAAATGTCSERLEAAATTHARRALRRRRRAPRAGRGAQRGGADRRDLRVAGRAA